MEGTISIADLKAAFGNFDAVSMNQTKILDRILGIISGEVPLQSNPKTNSLVDQIGPESKSNQDKRKADNKGNKETENKKDTDDKKTSKNPISNIAATIKSSLSDSVFKKITPVKSDRKVEEADKPKPKQSLITSVIEKIKPKKEETVNKKIETKTPFAREEVNIDLPPKTKVTLEDILETENIKAFDRWKPYLEIITGSVKDKKDKKNKKDDKDSLLKEIFPMAAKLLGPVLGALGTMFLGAGAAIGSVALLFNGLMDSGPFKGLKKLLGRGGLAVGLSLIKKGAVKFVTTVKNFAKMFFDPKKVEAVGKLLGMKAKSLGKSLLELPGKLFGKIFNSFKGIFGGVTKAAAGTAAKAGGKGILGRLAGMAGGFLLKGIKKIPIIGSLIGIGFAISRIAKGDFIGGLLDLASAAATAIPVVGTALSIAIDVFSAYRDSKTGGSEKAGAANKDWMSNAWKWVKESFMKIPLIQHLTDMGTHIGEGKYGEAFMDIATLIPGVSFLVELFNQEKTAISDLSASGKPITFSSVLKATGGALIKAILNMLPESILGVSIRSRVADMLGISGYGDTKDDTQPAPSTSSTPAPSKSTGNTTANAATPETPTDNTSAGNVQPSTPEAPTNNIQPVTPEVPSTQSAAAAPSENDTNLGDVHGSIQEQNKMIASLVKINKQMAEGMAAMKSSSNNVNVMNVNNNPTAFLTPATSNSSRRFDSINR